MKKPTLEEATILGGIIAMLANDLLFKKYAIKKRYQILIITLLCLIVLLILYVIPYITGGE